MGTLPLAARDKIDVVTLTNGDRITGEIRELTLGYLTVKTDAMGTVKIEWPMVARIDSPQYFELEHWSGERLFGTITSGEEAGQLRITSPLDQVQIMGHDEIVRIAALESAWRERWKGNIDLGYSFTSSNNNSQLSLGGEARYRSEANLLRLELTSISSSREDAESTNWTTLTGRYERTLANRWFWSGFGRLEQNEENQLRLRATAGGGGGRYLLQTNRNVVSALGGLAGNREVYTGEEDDSGWTGEIVLSVTHEFFLFGDHETSLSTSLTIFPSFTDWGRVRSELSSSFRRELISDFTISLSFTDSYDNEPPAGASKNDTRFVTSLGWTF